MMLAKSLQSAAGNAAGEANYIESVFQTHLYTGNGSTQTITNGIDLAGEGGLVWCKDRTTADGHRLFNTAVGSSYWLSSNTTSGNTFETTALTSFNSNGFTLGSSSTANFNTDQYASWTFRKQPKFFDVVTWTGNGAASQLINHNLASVPGMVICKNTTTTAFTNNDWRVWHRGTGTNPVNGLKLNATDAALYPSATNAASFTSTTFDAAQVLDSGANPSNQNGAQYVAYLFAHNAGGFGLTGADNVISCGSFTPDALGNATVNLGYEPQWILYKGVSGAGGTDSWVILDTMRGWDLTASDRRLFPNTSGAENTSSCGYPTATGFEVENLSASPYIYIAIRRGPMKVPTDGTSVFSAKTYSATTSSAQVTHDVTFDAEINANRDYSGGAKFLIVDSLRGINGVNLWTASTNLENSFPTYWSRKDQRTMYAPSAFDQWWASNSGTQGHISYGLVRAPGFFDEVCYTGTGVARTVAHNLAAVPELMIVKSRSGTTAWRVYSSALLATQFLELNSTAAAASSTALWNSTRPSSSVFTVGSSTSVNGSSTTYVSYLFATCPGVSKVFSFTGNGSSQTINCGFTAGARFVMIKRTDDTGDWYVWDSARGIVSGDDPHLSLNSTAAEVTNDDSVDTDSTGFIVNQLSATNINVSSATYIGIAIA